MSMLIATRTLRIRNTDGDISFSVMLHAPEIDGSSWLCRYEIGWPSGSRLSAGHGVDAIQALNLTMQKIGIDLYMSEAHLTGNLFWERKGEGYGFPLPQNASDLLEGADKHFGV
jgi:hypothetical protein